MQGMCSLRRARCSILQHARVVGVRAHTSRFLTTVVPSASAARSRMRLDRDFEPGSLTWPSILVMG